MISLKEAQRKVLEKITSFEAREIPLSECLNLVTSVPLYSEESIPPFDNTAVDGFALTYEAAKQRGVELEIIGTIAAGDWIDTPLTNSTTVRIMTGAPVPPGTDCVLMVEDSRVTEKDGKNYLSFDKELKKQENIREAGSDIEKGQLLFPAYTQLSPGHIGVLASLGYEKVHAFRKATVAILSTGNELTNESGPLPPGQIRDSNRPTLSCIVSQMGAIPIDFGTIRDDPESLRQAFKQAADRCDVVLSSGGVSVGDFDYTKSVLDELSNGTMSWMQIAIRPAKPFAFGFIGGVPVFGLPGNPVSSMVSFELLARPAIRKMMGHQSLHRKSINAIAKNALKRKPDGKIHFMRVTAELNPDGRVYIEPQVGQSSHLLYSMANSNALAVVPDGPGVAAGEEVEALILGEL